MNKIIYSIFVSSAFFVNSFTLNTLDVRGYSDLHNVILKENVIDKNATDTDKVAQVKLLLANGAIVDFADSYGRTPLWWAAERNMPLVMATLIDAGANVNGNNEHIPLGIAACDGNKEAVELLLSRGANTNIIGEDGCTPLHDAARGEAWLYPSTLPELKICNPKKLQDYKDIISLLIKSGAPTTNKDDAGLTPAQLARKQQKEFYPKIKGCELAEHIEKCIKG